MAPKQRKLFVTGIGTDVGKTIASAILTEALQADYWKPIQAGDLEHSDSIKIKSQISNSKSQICLTCSALQHVKPHILVVIRTISITYKLVLLCVYEAATFSKVTFISWYK